MAVVNLSTVNLIKNSETSQLSIYNNDDSSNQLLVTPIVLLKENNNSDENNENETFNDADEDFIKTRSNNSSVGIMDDCYDNNNEQKLTNETENNTNTNNKISV